MRAIPLFTFFVVLCVGCSTTQTVPDAIDSETINTVAMSCKQPYLLTQDCSIWSGATRKVVIDGFEVNIAGTQDGTVILVMDSHFFKNVASDPFTFNSKSHSTAVNNSYNAIRKALDAHNVQVKKVRPLKSFGNIDGYVLELMADGYSMLHSSPITSAGSGAQTAKGTQPAAGWAVEPSKFYDVCLPIHTQLATGRKEESPKIVAHYICKLIEGVCKSSPTSDDCQKGQKEIREFLDIKQ